MFQALRDAGDGVRFLWVPNLLRPDVALALIAGLTTALMMAVNPDLPEQVRLFMIIVPSVIAIVAALQFSSALAIYWATSNTFSALQTVLLHAVVRRRVRVRGDCKRLTAKHRRYEARALISRLEQLDRIAVGIFHLYLFAAGSYFHLVSQTKPSFLHRLVRRG